MKLLPRKIDIDKVKAQERKQEIDSGIALAKSVDKLRETKLLEAKQLKEWREANLKVVQQEIDSYIEVRDNLKKQTEEAEVYRKKLIEPLDKEWAEVNQTKAQLIKEKHEIYLSGEQLKEKEIKVEQERQKVSQIVSRVTQNEKDTIKAKEETTSLKELAHKEYEMAREEHDKQTDRHERALSAIAQQEKEYEVATKTIEIREKEVREKESELIIREQHLASQQAQLRVAREVIKQND